MTRGRGNDSNERPGRWVTQTRNRLTARREEKPRTKAGQIRALWREIEAALADGQSLSSIRDWLEEEGVVVTRATLSSYKRRFRRRDEVKRKAHVLEALIRQNDHAFNTTGSTQEDSPQRSRSSDEQNLRSTNEHDPYAQARRALEDKAFDIRTIHGDGDPTGKNLV